ncbi:hypothetical protein PUNSTDRAFT_126818 [Punctularia strigosozonata HHB-11173 SS5]|uniref:uncharacterized protein n=1 Tax=Punctularia strigosozonata (strain HHB-11173) TaxID=741275 RepID=UPI00044186E4|nr:uncharacterized protein PUNSTDRAFT_126818 [Punctularia strigosozonata HHB-11173 SS5]EIN08015.1 hypothetical protein PUNSTDRAFT_126818 [Punctularia strigosozonata HHB-11173 SS5]
MATMVLPPPPRTQGILLNPSPKPRLSALPFPTDLSSSFTSAVSDEDASSTDASQNYIYARRQPGSHSSSFSQPRTSSVPLSSLSRSSSRKIRFAPLPDPRRDEDENGDVGGELPAASTSTQTSEAPSNSARQADGEWEVLRGSDGESPPANEPSVSPCVSASASTSYIDYAPQAPPSPFVKKTRKLFRPFLQKHGITTSNLNVSTEDVLTLGATYLYRAAKSSAQEDSGYESSSVSEKDFGEPLSRSSSIASTASLRMQHPQRTMFGIPFRRTQSYTPETSGLSRTASRGSTKTVGSSRTVKPAPKHGQRMLNGRVYGQKRNRQNQNLFATAKDEEPEFVEWGYGGMGSVKAASGGNAMWKPLQSSQSTHGASADDDDPSGMAWVKRRREQREREKAEREAKEKAETEAAMKADAEPQNSQNSGQPSEEDVTPTLAEQSTSEQAADVEVPVLAEKVASPEPEEVASPERVEGASPKLVEDEHATILRNLPAPYPLVHRRTLSSRLVSGEATPEEGMVFISPPAEVDHKVENEAESSEDEDEEESSAREFDDAEDDEEVDIDEQNRITALSAGMEKISKHKNEKDQRAGVQPN